MAHLMLGVLGAMQVTLADGDTVKFRSDQTRALLAYLAVEADRPHRREALTGLLWPDEPEETARHNLRQALLNLRQAIGDPSANPPFLDISRYEIQFNTASDFALDVADFDAHLAACTSHPHARLDACAICAPRLQQAVDLYRGQFLQEFFLENSAAFEEWALARREAFHQRALEALNALATYYEQHGDLGATRRSALRTLELDPWREQAHRQMMRVFALEGQYGAALAQYETCRRVLAEEMDVEPSTETRELYEQLKTGKWNVRGSKQPPASDSHPPVSNLPVNLTPFIGRTRELADLAQLIGDPNCRLITLVGPGGMGKTRLAVQAASQQRHAFAQGVAFVPLVAIDSVEAMVPAIADALGFSFYGPTSPRLQLFGYLRDKRLLLVLDNIEQLLVEDPVQGNAANLLIGLLEHASGITLLVTSREPLNVQGEWVFPVEGLQIPEGDPSEDIESSAAAALFVQRAKRARAGFTVSEKDYPPLARLCQLVDGAPLALELAATWTRTLSLLEIVREIEHNLGFLQATLRDLPERHRSMRAVFEHSWNLLSAEEQQVLARLTVFRGGFRREAAELVAEATLTVLSTLVTKSLVRRSDGGRYDLHELIRQFAAERFSERRQDQTATQARHSSYYLRYFGQADGRLRSSAQRETLAELTAEIDNFRSAWDWAVTHGEFDAIEQTMRLFVMLYDTRGWLQEGLDMLGRAVSALETVYGPLPPDRRNQVALGHTMIARAVLASRLGQFEPAQTMLERSLEILRPLNEPRVLVEAITFLGNVMEFAGNYPKASELYSEGLEIATAIGDRWFAALCFLFLAGEGSLRLPTTKPEESHERLRSVVADWRLIGDPRLTALALNNLSWMAVKLGRYGEARDALKESVSLDTSIGDRWGLGFAYRGLGLIAQAQGEHPQAVDMFRQSLDRFTEVGARQDAARVLVEMSRSILALGSDAEAERGWREALHISTETQSAFVALEALAGMAALRAKQGNTEQALEWSLMVLNHPDSLQETRDRMENLRMELESQLTPQEIQASQAKARTLRIEQAFSQVLAQT